MADPSSSCTEQRMMSFPNWKLGPSQLRMGLLIKEFRKRVDTPVRVVIGDPIGRNVLDPMAKDAKAMMDFLRKATYELSPDPAKSFDLGFEFEDRHRADR